MLQGFHVSWLPDREHILWVRNPSRTATTPEGERKFNGHVDLHSRDRPAGRRDRGPGRITVMRLSDILESAGYRRIPMHRSGVGHFHVPGMLSGRRVSVLVDTGAGCTLVSLAVAHELDLDLSETEEQGGGAGGAALTIYTVEDARLELDEVEIRPEKLYAMDLTHANEALALQGAGPVEAIMGIDVFEVHEAVIDYGGQALFLRHREER